MEDAGDGTEEESDGLGVEIAGGVLFRQRGFLAERGAMELRWEMWRYSGRGSGGCVGQWVRSAVGGSEESWKGSKGRMVVRGNPEVHPREAECGGGLCVSEERSGGVWGPCGWHASEKQEG